MSVRWQISVSNFNANNNIQGTIVSYSALQENVPLGGNTCLGCGPFELGQFWCREQHFSPVASLRHNNAPLVCYTSGSNTDAQCTIWAKAPLTQPTANGYTKVVDLGWVVVVGSEPVHDSLHVTYRLLAPGTEPSRGPQPIKLNNLLISLNYVRLR